MIEHVCPISRYPSIPKFLYLSNIQPISSIDIGTYDALDFDFSLLKRLLIVSR